MTERRLRRRGTCGTGRFTDANGTVVAVMKPRNAPSRSARTSAPRPPRVARAPGRRRGLARPGALATRGGRGAEVRADRLGAFLGFMTTTVPFASVNLPVPHVPRRRSRGYDTTRPHRRQPDIIPSSVGPVRQARGRCPRPAYGCGGSALPPRVTVDRAHRRSRQSYVSPRGVAPAAVSLVALVTVTTNRSSSPASLVSR